MVVLWLEIGFVYDAAPFGMMESVGIERWNEHMVGLEALGLLGSLGALGMPR